MAKPEPNENVKTSVKAARTFYIVLYFLFYVSVGFYPNSLKTALTENVLYFVWYCLV